MKFYLYILCCFFALGTSATAQQPSSSSIEITNQKALSLQELIHAIETQSNFSFVYNPHDIQKFTVKLLPNTYTIKQLCNEIEIQCGIKLFIKSHQIIIQKKRETYNIHGTIYDQSNGETLIGASITLVSKAAGTASNIYGFYSLSLPEGDYDIQVSYIGYKTIQQNIHLDKNQELDFELHPHSSELGTVELHQSTENFLKKANIGNNLLQMKEVKALPAVGGEADVIKSLATLPGIQTANEGNINFSVRGGSFDQNLIMLDGAPVYNPSHALGFFSTFNPDAIKHIEIHKGVIPAQYGGRVSSLIDVRMKEGNTKRKAIKGGIGLAASRLSYEQGLGNGSFLIAGRYSYIGHTINQLGVLAKELGTANNFTEGNEIDFYDINLKLNQKINDNNHLYFSSYLGKDHFYYKDLDAKSSMDWGNNTATLRWTHIFNDKLFSHTNLIYSNYNYAFFLKDDARFFEWTSDLKEYDIKMHFNYYLNPANLLRFGWEANYHIFEPGRLSPRNESSIIETQELEKKQALETVFYLSNEQKIGSKWLVNYGLRFTPFLLLGPGNVNQYGSDQQTIIGTESYESGTTIQSYQAWEPRLSLSYELAASSTLKAGYGKNYQFLHLISNSGIGLPTDIWLPSDAHIKPQQGEQVSLGYFHQFSDNNYEMSLETYYKDFKNLVDFKDNADLFLNEQIETQIRNGTGWAYGLELLVKKKKGKTTGWLSYTWSRSFRKVSQVNNNEAYPAAFDKPHNISVVLQHQLNNNWSFSTNFNFSSGSNITVPQGAFVVDGAAFTHYTSRNGYRLPNYHRLDLAFSYKKATKAHRESEWIFGVYNVYGRKNIFSLYFQQDEHNLAQTKAYQLYLYGAMPYITYNFSF